MITIILVGDKTWEILKRLKKSTRSQRLGFRPGIPVEHNRYIGVDRYEAQDETMKMVDAGFFEELRSRRY